MTRAIVLGFVALAGCAKVEPPAHDNRPLVVVDDVANPTKVTETLYTLVLAEDGIRLPASLTYDRQTVIATDPSCRFGQLAGVAVQPLAIAAAGAAGTSTVQTLIGVDNPRLGSAIAQLSVSYELPYTCNGEQVLTGETTFTFLPNRINRRDTVSPAASAFASAAGCPQCGPTMPTTELTFSSYWRMKLADEKFYRPDGTEYVSGAAPPGACALVNGKLVAVQWRGDGEQQRLDRSTFIHDWVREKAIAPGERSVRSDLVFSDETDPARCGDVLRGRTDPVLTVDGEPVAAGEDGIYITEARGDRIELSAETAIPHGFAVYVPRLILHIYSVTNGAGPVAHVRQPTRDGYLFWFDDPLAAGDTIAIELD